MISGSEDENWTSNTCSFGDSRRARNTSELEQAAENGPGTGPASPHDSALCGRPLEHRSGGGTAHYKTDSGQVASALSRQTTGWFARRTPTGHAAQTK